MQKIGSNTVNGAPQFLKIINNIGCPIASKLILGSNTVTGYVNLCRKSKI